MNNQNMNSPVWDDAFNCWFAQASVALHNMRPNNINTLQMFLVSAITSICEYCAGPCGTCSKRYSGEPYACDDCPQDHLGDLTACHCCPYMPIERPELDG